jgi:hypothetical protein
MPDSRRNHYRIAFPLAERPSLVVERLTFDVVECSETGLRFDVGDRRSPEMGSRLMGQILFRSGESLDVGGDVVRLKDGSVALALQPPGIPFALIIRQQRYLRGKGYQLTD